MERQWRIGLAGLARRAVAKEDQIWPMDSHPQARRQIFAGWEGHRRMADPDGMFPEFADESQSAPRIVLSDPVTDLAKVEDGPRRKDDRLQTGLIKAR